MVIKSIFSETGAVLQEAVQKGILNWNWNRKKKNSTTGTASPRLLCLSVQWKTSRLLANQSAHISGISLAILIILILNHDDDRSIKTNTSPSISLFIQMNSFFALPYVRVTFQIISLSSLNYLRFSSIFLSFIFHWFFRRVLSSKPWLFFCSRLQRTVGHKSNEI